MSWNWAASRKSAPSVRTAARTPSPAGRSQWERCWRMVELTAGGRKTQASVNKQETGSRTRTQPEKWSLVMRLIYRTTKTTLQLKAPCVLQCIPVQTALCRWSTRLQQVWQGCDGYVSTEFLIDNLQVSNFLRCTFRVNAGLWPPQNSEKQLLQFFFLLCCPESFR